MNSLGTPSRNWTGLVRLAGTTLTAFALGACGGSSTSGPSSQGTATGSTSLLEPDAAYDVALSGSVGDGPIAGAELIFKSHTGELLATMMSSPEADYRLDIKTLGRHYPLVVKARGGLDLVTNLPAEFDLTSALTGPSKTAVANLNPFTTLAIAAARDMDGGLTKTNIALAVRYVVGNFNFGLVELAAGSPMTTTIDASNAAEMVKSSEALAELFRRTRDVMLEAHGTASIGDVIEALGSDIADGVLDGQGAAGTDAHVTAAATVVAAEVLIESLANRLHVHGKPVTAALDDVIEFLGAGGTGSSTASLPATAAQIAQARTGIDAALVIAPSAALEALRADLDTLAPGMLPAAVRERLPASAEAELGAAVTRIASGLASDIDSVNTISAVATSTIPETVADTAPDSDSGASPDTDTSPGTGSQPDPVDTAPTISGTAPMRVLSGEPYWFQPIAHDADGDVLSYSIDNRPVWAGFDAATGVLHGTPTAADVGSYANVRISVTDGVTTAGLAAFSIAVDALGTGSASLSWQPPTQNTDGSPLSGLAGYTVHWGKTSGDYAYAVTLSNAGLTSYLVESLGTGTYYFATRAFTSNGVYSGYSNEASTTIL